MDSINTNIELKVAIEKPFNSFACLYIFDYRGKLQGDYSLEKPLSLVLTTGLYKFRIEFNYTISDHLLDITKDQSIYIGYNKPEVDEDLYLPLNELYSCLPLRFSTNSKRYLEDGDNRLFYIFTTERKQTKARADINIFFLLRRESDQRFLMGNSEINLYNKNGKRVASILNIIEKSPPDRDATVINYNDSLFCGNYFLELDNRMIPFSIMARQRTDIFITFSDRRFQISTLRIVHSAHGKYNPADPGLIVLELLLSRMHNNNYGIPASLIEYILSIETACSTLYLICCYLLCQNKELDPNDKTISRLHFELWRRTHDYIENLPDHVAIRSILDDKRNKTPLYSTRMTPMFRIGYGCLLQAGIRHDNVILTGSVNSALMGEILFDSVINTFTTTNLKETLQSGFQDKPYYTDFDGQEISILEGLDDATFTQIIQRLSEGIFDQDWLATSIATRLNENIDDTVSSISAAIQMPKAIVFSKIQSMKRQLIEEKELEYSWK